MIKHLDYIKKYGNKGKIKLSIWVGSFFTLVSFFWASFDYWHSNSWGSLMVLIKFDVLMERIFLSLCTGIAVALLYYLYLAYIYKKQKNVDNLQNNS